MGRLKKIITEYRNYELPTDFPIICLTGERWRISDIRSNNQHFHNCFEIGICHEHHGNMEVFGKPIPFQAGDVTCVPKNIPHTTYSSPGVQSLWSYLFFNPSDFLKNLIPANSVYYNFDNGLFSNHFLKLNAENDPYFFGLVSAIVKEMTEQKPHYQIAVRGMLQILCIELIRFQEVSNPIDTNDADNEGIADSQIADNSISPDLSESSNKNVLAPALDYIEKNYMHQFTVEDLATMCHLSETHFRRVFTSVIGSSPLDFITYTRIMAACNLLRSTEDSILEISEMVGFRSISSFNRSFQKFLGQAPREYRNKLDNGEIPQSRQSIIEYNGWL